jgi:hypothetical protein
VRHACRDPVRVGEGPCIFTRIPFFLLLTEASAQNFLLKFLQVISYVFLPIFSKIPHDARVRHVGSFAYSRLLTLHSLSSADHVHVRASTLATPARDAEHALFTASLADLADVDSSPTPNDNSNDSVDWERISVCEARAWLCHRAVCLAGDCDDRWGVFLFFSYH